MHKGTGHTPEETRKLFKAIGEWMDSPRYAEYQAIREARRIEYYKLQQQKKK